jgi:hypothetical protein
MPYVRCVSSARGAAEIVAKSLSKQLKVYKDEHPDFKPWGDQANIGKGSDGEMLAGPGSRVLRPGEPPEPATVFVIDRADDLAAAVLHDISYCSLVTDLLGHEPCTPFHFSFSKGGVTTERDVLLDDSDPVWRSLRYEEMGAVVEAVDNGVRAANRRFEDRKKLDASDVNDLRKMMAALTTDEKIVDDKFAQHYRMKQQVIELFEQRNTHELCTLEQMLVTGCDAEGDRVASKELERLMRAMLQDDRLTDEDQARLLILYILCAKSVDARVRNELLAMSRVSKRNQSAVVNLTNLSVPLQRTASEPKSDCAPFADEDTFKRYRKLTQDSSKLCRYVPKAEDIVRQHLGGTLPEDLYPWMRAPTIKKGGAGNASGSGGNFGQPLAVNHTVAVHGHGEVVNKYTAKVLSDGSTLDRKDIRNAKTKKSKFASTGDDGTPLSGSSTPGNGGDGGGRGGKVDDFYLKYLEPIRPRVYDGGRIVVFFVGGITQFEIAALDRLSKETNREIIYGGTSLLTPKDMLEQLYECESTVDLEDMVFRSTSAKPAPKASGKAAKGNKKPVDPTVAWASVDDF